MATRGCAEGPGPPASWPPCRTGNKHLLRRDDISTIVAFRRVSLTPAWRHVAVAGRTDGRAENPRNGLGGLGGGWVGWREGRGWCLGAEGHLRCGGVTECHARSSSRTLASSGGRVYASEATGIDLKRSIYTEDYELSGKKRTTSRIYSNQVVQTRHCDH